MLELGPGPGLTTEAIAPMTDRLTAVEIDEELAAIAADRTRALGNVDVRVGDATDLAFEDGQFSAVICMTMLHHLPDSGRAGPAVRRGLPGTAARRDAWSDRTTWARVCGSS